MKRAILTLAIALAGAARLPAAVVTGSASYAGHGGTSAWVDGGACGHAGWSSPLGPNGSAGENCAALKTACSGTWDDTSSASAHRGIVEVVPPPARSGSNDATSPPTDCRDLVPDSEAQNLSQA